MGAEGAKHFAQALVANQSLTSLKYAPYLDDKLHHLSIALDVCYQFSCSLSNNNFNHEAVKHLSEGLEQNTSLTSLKCAACPYACLLMSTLIDCQQPLTLRLDSRAQLGLHQDGFSGSSAPLRGAQAEHRPDLA